MSKIQGDFVRQVAQTVVIIPSPSMGSPFPLLSSGQSLQDERPGYSPRDFGMVPQTPQIPGHRRSTDQSVPRTPDDAIVPSSQRLYLTEEQSVTPFGALVMNHNSTETPRVSARHRNEDSPSTNPDQQVPATPVGGFLLPASYQSPVPYYSHFTSPSTQSLQSSQEVTVPHMNNAMHSEICTPHFQHTDRQVIQSRSYPTPGDLDRRRHMHTRQTPSLSSRRRLTLEPVIETISPREQNLELVQQITLSTVEVQHGTCNSPSNNSFLQDQTCIQNDLESNLQYPEKLNKSFEGENIEIDVEESDSCSLPLFLSTGNVTGEGNPSQMSNTPNNVMNIQHKLPQCPSSHMDPIPNTNCFHSFTHDSSTMKTEDDEDSKRAEIKRRVQKVLDCGPAITVTESEDSESQHSLLTLLDDKDFVI